MYAGSKILLARKKQVFFDMKSRKPRNSRVFEWYAKNKGYEVFDPGDMKFQDVLGRMAGASKVVSYHGGALVNLLACKPGTQVSEIYSEWYADCFEQISLSCKLDYTSYFYEMKKRPDLIRTAYYLLFKIQRKAYIKHFRIKYRDFNSILQV
jgi:capsular polysaccharide biosynthesis protein